MLILASKSPRRKQLLAKYLTSNFIIIPSQYNEEIDNNISPLENVKKIAYKKGEEIYKKYPHDIIISADTIVTLNNKIYGKPIDKLDAYRILKELNNNTHEVITAYSIFFKDKIINNFVVSKVSFNNNDDSLINSYIETLSPLDKAGGYGIQDELGSKLIKSYSGSLNNIIGFPIEEIKKDLEKVINIEDL